MAWQIKITKRADKAFRKLPQQVAEQLLNTLEDISQQEDPRSQGKPLKGNLSGLWRYRVGNYRIICDIYDNELIILIIDAGHRKNIYNN